MAEGDRQPGDRFSWSEVRRVAAQRFGHERFRPGQRELISSALGGRDVLGILPTGAGKSLCYQLPSLFLQGTVVVVSPLIALMQDQHERLQQADIEAARLDSTIKQSDQREQELALSDGAHDVVLVTPERLQSAEHLEPLRERGVALFVVDEAHCVSQWGHDFRPAYAELRHVIAQLGNPPIMALTATAPANVVEDILTSLGMRDPEIIYGGIERPNLSFEVARTVNEEEKRRQLLELVAATPGAGILYAATVRQVEELYDWLSATDIPIARYHGKLTAKQRGTAQEKFMSGEARLMLATQAFGMGIDKPDIRFVVHWNFPESIESYYQEAGRAGRDGEPARVTLFYRLEDKRIRSFFVGSKHPKREEALTLTRALSSLCRAQGSCTMQALAQAAGYTLRRTQVIAAVLDRMNLVRRSGRTLVLRRRFEPAELEAFLGTFEARQSADRERIAMMMRYGQTTRCRMQFLREYFGDPAGDACNHCDNCQHPDPVPQPTPGEARSASGLSPARAARSQATRSPGAFVRSGS